MAAHAVLVELERFVLPVTREIETVDRGKVRPVGRVAADDPRVVVELEWIGDVQPQTLERTGAVSQETAVEMVSGALARYGASVAVAVTGVAGPGGGTPDKPVGTVWIGWKRRGGYARAELFHFDGDREAVRRQTVGAALEGVRRILTS